MHRSACTDVQDQLQGARIARLVVAGNVLAPANVKDEKKTVSSRLDCH